MHDSGNSNLFNKHSIITNFCTIQHWRVVAALKVSTKVKFMVSHTWLDDVIHYEQQYEARQGVKQGQSSVHMIERQSATEYKFLMSGHNVDFFLLEDQTCKQWTLNSNIRSSSEMERTASYTTGNIRNMINLVIVMFRTPVLPCEAGFQRDAYKININLKLVERKNICSRVLLKWIHQNKMRDKKRTGIISWPPQIIHHQPLQWSHYPQHCPPPNCE